MISILETVPLVKPIINKAMSVACGKMNTVITLCVQMLLKKISSSDINPPQNDIKPSQKEGLPKVVNSCQEQTLQELLMQLDSVLTPKVILFYASPFSQCVSFYVSLFYITSMHFCYEYLAHFLLMSVFLQ
jgi:hypothetical protein